MAIHLGRPLPDGSSGQPGGSGGQPSNAPLFDLAPGGVYLAAPVARGAGALLPHPFSLTGGPRGDRRAPVLPPSPGSGARRPAGAGRAVCSLLHLPSGHPDRALPGTLPCGARTFLPRFVGRETAPPATACFGTTDGAIVARSPSKEEPVGHEKTSKGAMSCEPDAAKRGPRTGRGWCRRTWLARITPARSPPPS